MALRGETIGSLLRPDYLLDARRRLERGDLTPPEFKRIEDRAVDEAVALQEDAGLDVVTDGEMRRYAFFGHLVDALEGFDKSAAGPSRFATTRATRRTLERPVVVDKLRWRRQMSVEEFTYLRGRTKRAGQGDAAQRAAGGGVLRSRQVARRLRDARRLPRRPRRFHAARDCRSCAGSAATTSRSTRRSTRRCSTRRFARATASAAAIPTGCSTRASSSTTRSSRAPRRHVRHPHLPRQPQEHVLRVRRLRPDRGARVPPLALPSLPARVRRRAVGDVRAAASRAGRSDRGARAGQLEEAAAGIGERARARIAEAARVVPLERLALSPQCGFASTHEGNRLSPDEQRRKLELVGRTARRVWSTDLYTVL